MAESLDPATTSSAVARRYGLHASQLFVWRQQLQRSASSAGRSAGRRSCRCCWRRTAPARPRRQAGWRLRSARPWYGSGPMWTPRRCGGCSRWCGAWRDRGPVGGAHPARGPAGRLQQGHGWLGRLGAAGAAGRPVRRAMSSSSAPRRPRRTSFSLPIAVRAGRISLAPPLRTAPACPGGGTARWVGAPSGRGPAGFHARAAGLDVRCRGLHRDRARRAASKHQGARASGRGSRGHVGQSSGGRSIIGRSSVRGAARCHNTHHHRLRSCA